MALETYRRKRDFKKTPEPGGRGTRGKGRAFVVQKHHARALHYDFRLEMDGVLKSWAVPKGPSLNPADKRLAVEVEDHPLAYGGFEGTIPAGQYGAGSVIIWDRGNWQPEGDAKAGYRKGHLAFTLDGEKLRGRWNLVRKAGQKGEKAAWFLMKSNDAAARSNGSIVEEQPASVVSGKGVDDLPPHAKPPPKVRKVKVGAGRKAAMPAFATPLLPTLVRAVPQGERWLHEIKYDGYRTLVYKNGAQVQCLTRKGLDWTARYGPRIGAALKALPYQTLILDGEVVALDKKGVSNFAALQAALTDGPTDALVLYLFDVLYVEGRDLRKEPLEQRRAVLEEMLAPLGKAGPLYLSGALEGEGRGLLGAACAKGLEGIVSKNLDGTYMHGRSRTWVKTKCHTSGTFIIAGYSTEGKRSLRSLVMAEKVRGELRYIGRVGTGFNAANLKPLLAALKDLQRKTPPLEVPRGVKRSDVTWVEPRLLAEVEYRTRTAENFLRQASFKGLRPDKQEGDAMAETVKDKPVKMPAKAAAKARKGGQPAHVLSEEDLAAITISHPERRLFGDADVSKLDVAVYDAQVGDWMIPHIIGRPLSLIRCTSDNPESCFYQRHFGQGMPKLMRKIRLREDKGQHGDYIFFEEPKGFLELAQFGVVEVHPWNCRVDDPEHPDQVIFDLDPDEGLPWRTLVEGMVLVKEWLEERGFTCFVKTTGGKGAHLVLPLAPQPDWDETKALAKQVAESLSAEYPERFTARLPKASRRGKIFIDYLRNGRSATAVAPYSLRARAGGPVALPLAWEDFRKVKDPRAFTFETVPPLLRKRADPWADFRAAKTAKANTRALLALQDKPKRKG